MSAEKSVVTVTIAGEDYTLRSEATSEYTRECAKYVDATISDIQRKSRSTMEPHKAAILAALSIVDQYLKTVRELEALRSSSAAAADHMAEQIETRLAPFDLASRL